MSNARVSQAIVETVINPTDQKTIVSQAFVEVVASPTDQVMTISQMVLEVLTFTKLKSGRSNIQTIFHGMHNNV